MPNNQVARSRRRSGQTFRPIGRSRRRSAPLSERRPSIPRCESPHEDSARTKALRPPRPMRASFIGGFPHRPSGHIGADGSQVLRSVSLRAAACQRGRFSGDHRADDTGRHVDFLQAFDLAVRCPAWTLRTANRPYILHRHAASLCSSVVQALLTMTPQEFEKKEPSVSS